MNAESLRTPTEREFQNYARAPKDYVIQKHCRYQNIFQRLSPRDPFAREHQTAARERHIIASNKTAFNELQAPVGRLDQQLHRGHRGCCINVLRETAVQRCHVLAWILTVLLESHKVLQFRIHVFFHFFLSRKQIKKEEGE